MPDIYTVTLSAGSPSFTIYPLEANGPNNVSVPRQIQVANVGASFEINGDLTYRFVAGQTFTVTVPGSPSANDGVYTVAGGGSSYSSGTNRTTIPVVETGQITSAGPPLGTLFYSIPAAEEATSLTLPGRGYVNYGQLNSDSLVHLLENFASNVAPVNPLPGQLWFNTTTGVLQVYGAGSPAFANTGLQNIVEDLTPQLGGTLDVNTFDIVGAPAATVTSAGGNITLTGADGGATSGAGGAVTITSGQGGASAYGGALTITAGAGGATSGNGGELTIGGGDATTSGAGGSAYINGGNGTGTGSGGDIALQAGSGSGTGQVGGNIQMDAGQAGDGAGGSVYMNAATGVGTNRPGGSVQMYAGDSSGTAVGGNVLIQSGIGGATSGDGGAIDITSGAGGGQADGGAINLVSGNAGAGSGYRDGGAINITAGSRTQTAYGNGGDITLTGGNANYRFSYAGDVKLRGGSNTYANSNAVSGNIDLYGGAGYRAGAINITGGQGTVAGGSSSAGSVTIRGGDGNLSSGAGSAALFGGLGSATASPGDVQLAAGSVSGAGPGPGGNVTITSGNGNLAQPAGTISITGGSVSAGAGTGAGGDIAITSGDGGLTSGDAGDITLTPGTATSGSDGAINIAQTTAPSVTTNKLYNVSGALTWNGIDLTVNTLPDYDAQTGGSPPMTVFTTAFSFSTPAAGKASLQVYVNGVKQKEATGGSPYDGNYTISAPSTVTFTPGAGIEAADDIEFYGFG